MRLTLLTLRRLSAFLTSDRGILLTAGGMSGLYLLAWCHQFLATFGASLAAVTALALSVAAGLQLGQRARPAGGSARRLEDASGPDRILVTSGLVHFLLAAWMVAFPWLTSAAGTALGLMPAETMARAPMAVLSLGAAAMALLMLPAWGVARLPVLLYREVCAREAGRSSAGPREPEATRPSPDDLRAAKDKWRCSLPGSRAFRDYLAGIALGLAFNATFLAPLAGAQAGGWIAALAGGAIFLAGLLRADVAPAPVPRQAAGTSPASAVDRCGSLLTAGCVGAALALVFRILVQVVPASAFLFSIGWAAVVAGWALGLGWAERRARRGADVGALRGAGNLLAGAWVVALAAAFPLVIFVVLTLNSHVGSVALLTLSRGLLAALLLLPLAWAWGATCAPAARLDDGHEHAGGAPSFPTVDLTACILGFLAVRWIGLPQWGVAGSVTVVAWALLGLALFRFTAAWGTSPAWAVFRSANGRRRLRLGPVAFAGLIATVAAAPWLSANYQPTRSARLLFSTNVFLAKQAGTELALLTVLDEGRPIATVEADQGTHTLWKYRGAQYQLRESGIPKAAVSTDPRICPQYSAEVLPVAVPLVLHESPRRVLLLGLGGGVPLATCLDFPLLELTCAEGDGGLVRMLQEHVWPGCRLDPLSDERLRFLALDPTLALRCRGGRYDVIVSNPGLASLVQTSSALTREFYERAAGKLAPEGIFCQRFQSVDLGPAPLQAAVRTLAVAFRDVALLESAPGEFLLLATNSERGLSREGLVARLQAPHVRHTLAGLGWDWSVLLNLPFCRDAGRAEVAGPPRAGIHTAANGRFAFTLPQEVMRWGPKMREIAELLSPHGGSLLALDSLEGDDPDVRRRLSEVARQQQLVIEHPDQHWAYRKEVRQQLSERPRTRIVQVKGELPRQAIHPDERRRLAYFKALGDAAKSRPVRPEDVLNVERFAAPYDPLITYFLHHEAAELCARTAEPDVAGELVHRLYAVHFAHPHDRSVRNIAKALTLLADHPDALPPSERWDHLNALLQALKTRWELRAAFDPLPPRIQLNDIEQSLAALDAAFAAMTELCEDATLSDADWPARRAFLERSLVRPLRTHRTRLLPHHVRERRKSE